MNIATRGKYIEMILGISKHHPDILVGALEEMGDFMLVGLVKSLERIFAERQALVAKVEAVSSCLVHAGEQDH